MLYTTIGIDQETDRALETLRAASKNTRRPKGTAKAEIIRQAIRFYLDAKHQNDALRSFADEAVRVLTGFSTYGNISPAQQKMLDDLVARAPKVSA